jgi:hypothetical protein
MFTKYLFLLFISVFAFSAHLAAEVDGAVGGPAIQGLVVKINNLAPGFRHKGAVAADSGLFADFYVFISDLGTNRATIKRLQVEDLSGETWDIDLTTYAHPAQGYVGGVGHWFHRSETPLGRSILPLHYSVKLSLVDGRVLRESFDALPPGGDEGSGGKRLRFVVNRDFEARPCVPFAIVPEPAELRSLSLHDEMLTLDFVLNGTFIANCQLYFFDSAGNAIGYGSLASAAGGSSWLNEGKPLEFSGAINEASIPLSEVTWSAGKSRRDLAGVAVMTSDSQDPASNLMHLSSLYLAFSAIFRCDTDSLVPLLSPAAQAPAIASSAGANGWDGSEQASRDWELRLSGILSHLNGYGFSELAPFASGTASATLEAASIKSSWGIYDRATLLDNLNKLVKAGHSAIFDRCAAVIAANPGLDPEGWAALGADPSLSAPRFAFVRDYGPLAHGASLRAWDFSRLVYLARDGYALGFLSEEEAWSWLREAADALRDDYSSWLDFGQAYILGRRFWGSTDGDDKMDALFLNAIWAMDALMGPGGGWYHSPWPPRKAADDDCDQGAP